jgi:hypothetical protein
MVQALLASMIVVRILPGRDVDYESPEGVHPL